MKWSVFTLSIILLQCTVDNIQKFNYVINNSSNENLKLQKIKNKNVIEEMYLNQNEKITFTFSSKTETLNLSNVFKTDTIYLVLSNGKKINYGNCLSNGCSNNSRNIFNFNQYSLENKLTYTYLINNLDMLLAK